MTSAPSAPFATDAPTLDSLRFDRTLDAVDDLGWDRRGRRPISVPLESGTRIEVPPGTYLVADEQRAENLRRFALVGTGDRPEDVRFVPARGKALWFLNLRKGSRDVVVQNLSMDHGDRWEGCLGNAFVVDGGLRIQDVHYVGKTPNEHTGSVSLLPVYALDPAGVVTLDGVEMTGPSQLAKYPKNPLAVFTGDGHRGTLYVRNSRFANRGEHAIYASRCQGNVRVENCYFENNQNTHVRVAGDGSWVRDCTFVWDTDNHPNEGSFQGTTGLVFEAGFQGFAGGLAERCIFDCRSTGPNSGCLKVDGSHGGVTVRDCTFRVATGANAPAIQVDAPGDSHMIEGLPSSPHTVTLENVHVRHAGGRFDRYDAAVAIHDRDGSRLSNCCIDATGAMHGLRLSGGTYTVTDSAVAATKGNRVVVADANLTSQNFHAVANCRGLGGPGTSASVEAPDELGRTTGGSSAGDGS